MCIPVGASRASDYRQHGWLLQENNCSLPLSKTTYTMPVTTVRKTGFGLTILLLSACAPLSPPSTSGKVSLSQQEYLWEIHRKAIQELQQWSLSGRMALQVAKDGGNARLYWQQDHDNYTLRVIAPFGSGTYQLQGDPTEVSMHTPKQQVLTASDPESLMQQNLGWSLPLEGLRYWVRGIPDPAQPLTGMVLDSAGRLTDLQQAGWHIVIDRYQFLNALSLPAILTMTTDQAKIKLAIEQWQRP